MIPNPRGSLRFAQAPDRGAFGADRSLRSLGRRARTKPIVEELSARTWVASQRRYGASSRGARVWDQSSRAPIGGAGARLNPRDGEFSPEIASGFGPAMRAAGTILPRSDRGRRPRFARP